MSEILSTKELEYYIININMTKLQEFSDSEIKLSVNFQKGEENSWDGDYVFSEKEQYHFLSVERGKVVRAIITTNLFEITFLSFSGYVFNLALKYATINRKENQDFRRTLFDRELEIFSNISFEFYERKKKEIELVLEKNPYLD